jgi:hypothetical protein
MIMLAAGTALSSIGDGGAGGNGNAAESCAGDEAIEASKQPPATSSRIPTRGARRYGISSLIRKLAPITHPDFPGCTDFGCCELGQPGAPLSNLFSS